MTEPDLLDSLAQQALPEGGWGYAPDQEAHLEPTCLGLLALAADPGRFAPQREAARRWLEKCAVGDGTYRLARGRREAAWPTALVLFTRSALGEDAKSLDPVARALLAIRGRISDMRGEEDINDVDGTLIGWPWAEGNFSWVEPTAWACLALRAVGQEAHPRVAEGQKLLLDRVLETGGLNYGNRRIFGITLEPIPTPTSMALLALQGSQADQRVGQSLDYLAHHGEHADDVEHLGWAVLALDAYRVPGTHSPTLDRLQQRLRDALVRRQGTNYIRPAPLRLALAALALDLAQRNPFRLRTAEPVAKPLDPGKLSSGQPPIGDRVRSWFQGLAINATTSLKQLDPRAAVHVAPVSDYNADLADVLSRQFESFRERVPLKGKRVVLKPNLVEYHRDKVINTDPRVVAAAIELCRREGAAEVIVAEGPGHWRNVEYLVEASGLGDVLRHYNVPFIDLNHDEPIQRVNLGRLTKLPHLYLSKTIATAEVVISLPRLKTHHWAVATLSLKNLFGTLPGICYGWPKNELHWRGIHNSIVDIALTRTPDLAIVDGIVGMEGDGPLNGTPRAMGVLVMGTDLLAVDATCCRLMQLDPLQVGYLVLGATKKLGQFHEAAIEQLGETIAGRRQPFSTVDSFKGAWTGREQGRGRPYLYSLGIVVIRSSPSPRRTSWGGGWLVTAWRRCWKRASAF